MIYNLVQYLKTEFPAEKFYTNVSDISGTQVPDRMVHIRETSGDATAWFEYTEQRVQIMTRDIDSPKARDLAYDVYDKINNRFGLILPATTVDGTLYAALQTAEIHSDNLPQSIGYDENGRAEFTTTFRIIYRKG